MFQEPELEEGETCYYKDDANIDPDIALSYIGDKVQSILGHLQKDFEGGVSAENLGAKFGGYGSFLPMHQRSPSIWSQPKSPQKVPHLQEDPAPNSATVPDAPSTQRDSSSSQSLKTSYEDNLIRPKSALSSDKAAEVFPGKVKHPSSKSGNQPDQRTLKVRIKVGRERVAQYNAEIYNLGLTSPSSSEGDSHDESDGPLLESHETPNESPATILRIMTSLPVSGGLLLSPLCEDLLNLARETEYPVVSESEAARKSSSASAGLSKNDVSVGNKPKFVDKSRNFEKPEDEFMADLNDCKQKTLGSDNLKSNVQSFHGLNCKPLADKVTETEKDVRVKKKKGSKDRVKERSMNKTSLKVGPDATRSEHNGIGIPHDANSLSFEGEKKSKGNQSSGKLALNADSLRDGGYGAPENKYSGKKDVQRLQFSQKDVHTSSELMENPKRLSERASTEKTRNFNLDAVKAKPAHTDKLKEKSSNKRYSDRMSYDMLLSEPLPPAAGVLSKEGMFNGLEQAAVAPVVIQEDWVGCDRCQKWRLLPYGTKSEQLPEKWVCSMLDWLPGMNRCDISEDETTKAVQAKYLVPVPENQHSFQAHTDLGMSGVIPAGAHHFSQNHLQSASDQMKKQKLKKKQSKISMSDPVPSNGKEHLQRLAMKSGSSKEVKQSLLGANATNKSDIQHPSKSEIVSAKLNKRKGEHVIEDVENPKKKIKKESAQHIHAKLKRIKSSDELTMDNLQASGGNLGMTGHSLTSSLPNKSVVKDGKKKIAQKDAISGGTGKIQMSLKPQKDPMQGLPDNGSLVIKACNGREGATKKTKLKEYEDSQYQIESWENNVSNVKDGKASIKEDSKNGDFHRDKKSRVSQIEEKELRRSQGEDISKRKSSEARIRSSGGNKEYPINRGIEKEQKKSRSKMQLTIEDIDKLRKDLGCEPLSTAATSSSSKISDSRKNRISYMEAKGSPEESVSSSPIRMPYMNNAPATGSAKKFQDMNDSSELVVARKGTSGLTNDNGSEVLGSKIKLRDRTDVEDSHREPKLEVSSNTRHLFSDESSLKSVKKGTSMGKRDLGQSGDNKSENKSAQREKNSTQMEPWNGKLRIDLRQGDKQGVLNPSKHGSGSSGSLKRSHMGSRPVDASVVGDTSKALKDTAVACLQNGTDSFIKNEAEQSMALASSFGNKNVSGVTAPTALKQAEDVLKEAEELRNHADLIKNSGFTSESNYEYFKAGLKFLHGASLLEACSGDSSKHLEMSPMQMYGAAAKLCKTCANAYEKGHEMAAAALAYKCVEVAYLRIVYCKSSSTNRVWHDLQSSLQMVPQGESPSSSASDIDNLNNLATADKGTLSKGSGSHAGSHVIAPRNRPNFVRLLDFTKDVSSAMEAAKKSQDTFAASHVELQESQNKDAVASVKKVIDFSFQNIDELVRLIWAAFNTISHQGLSRD